jgi:cytochrome P450
LLILNLALRLYPSVPVNTRTAVENTILPVGGGSDRKSPVLIPKGTPVAFSVYALHRRSDLYGMDAECFRPERWDEDLPLFKDKTTHNYGYLPFSGGPRACLGSKFGFISSGLVMADTI